MSSNRTSELQENDNRDNAIVRKMNRDYMIDILKRFLQPTMNYGVYSLLNLDEKDMRLYGTSTRESRNTAEKNAKIRYFVWEALQRNGYVLPQKITEKFFASSMKNNLGHEIMADDELRGILTELLELLEKQDHYDIVTNTQKSVDDVVQG